MTTKLTRLAAAVAATVAAPLVLVGLATTTTAAANPGAAPATGVTPTSSIPPPICARRLEINDRRVYEGDLTDSSWPTLAVLTVSTEGCPIAGSVQWRTLSGTANSFDYTTSSGTLTFAPGETTKTIVTMVSRDGSPGPDEYFWVRLESPSTNVIIEDAYGRVTILNDDTVCVPPPSLPPGHPHWHCME